MKNTQRYIKTDWNKGLNSRVDAGFLDDSYLTIADNIVFAESGARIKREGMEYLDSGVATVTARSSSGTTRTLYFKSVSDQLIPSPTDNRLVAGEKINVASSASSGNELSYAETGATVLSVAAVSGGHTITYTGTGSLSESETATTGITVTRAESVLNITDYWRDVNNVKTQRLVYATDGFKLFYLDTDFDRFEIEGDKETTTVVCTAASSLTASGAGDYFVCYSGNDATKHVFWYDVDNGNTQPSVTGSPTYHEIDVAAADANTAVASATQAVVDAVSDFDASVTSATVTITNVDEGITTDTEGATAVSAAGFTVTTALDGATLPTSATKIDSKVLNNRLIMAFDTVGDKPIKYYPNSQANYQLLGGDPPDFSIMGVHLSRLWTNDKTNPDRLHYSSTGNPEEWQGTGDSGAIDIAPGDGDPRGITGIFPTFHGDLIVAKGTKLYRIRGFTPTTFAVRQITDGIGVESHASIVPIDNSDILFVSTRGVHSLGATDRFGDVEQQFLSRNIQANFKSFEQDELDAAHGVYIPELNSVAFSFTERDNTSPNDIWLFNIALQEWYRWPDISCVSLSRRIAANGITKMVIGTNGGRIVQTQRGTYTDFESSSYLYRIKTPVIYPGGDIQNIKVFRNLSFLYKPEGNFAFTVKIKIDNYESQTLQFEQESQGAQLGVDFILDESVLGVENRLAPYTKLIDGHGRGMTIEIQNNSSNEQIELYGFIIEYKAGDIKREVVE